ncbi:MAG: viperin family antiviral radical SAM protein [Acholeplasmatales bacterium]|nr:viperin family antiviral radical SAM protein [Acholeplasmatales bacterium]
MIYSCVNLHFTDFCNFNCSHCFVKKENNELSFEQLKIVVDKISNYYRENNIDGRINLAGGEPLLSRNIGNIIDYIYRKNIKVSIITNGYYLDESFIKSYGDKIDMIGISVDSLSFEGNMKIGRSYKANTLTREKIIYISSLIKGAGIRLKINTCLSKINCNEDFNLFINEIKPDRFKIFQMCCDETNSNSVSNEEVDVFLKRINYKYVYESSKDMEKSYVIIDSLGNVSTNNFHNSNISIFDYSLQEAIDILEINYMDYLKRYI